MRSRTRTISCKDDGGRDAAVIEWSIRPAGSCGEGATEYSLEDGSPVLRLGDYYEHFYSGEKLRPV